MARRERTTALPRHRPRGTKQETQRRFLGIALTEGRLRALILGTAGFALFVLLFAFGYRIYEDQVGRPNQVVLSVNDRDVKLSYYADRLLPWIRENQQSGISLTVLEDQLLNKLETELIIQEVAEERGIVITEADINQGIAESLGVSGGGSFDSLYRQKLEDERMSDGSYRRMVAASVANDRLLDQLKGEVGESGEQVELRTIVITPEAEGDDPVGAARQKAEDLLARVQDGEDMGAIAQAESADITTRQQDGLMLPEPEALLPEAVGEALAGKGEGELLGPIEVDTGTGVAFWVVRIERREEIEYTEPQREDLAQMRLDEAIAQKRANADIDRDFDASDARWAEGQLS